MNVNFESPDIYNDTCITNYVYNSFITGQIRMYNRYTYKEFLKMYLLPQHVWLTDNTKKMQYIRA